MSSIVTLNGIPYLIPDTGEVGWGQEVTNYLKAIGSGGLLQLEGGDFTLLNDVNFGPNYGLLSPYFKSGQPLPATSGVLRLTNTESVVWRNSDNTADLALTLVGDQLYFNNNPIGGGGGGSPLTTKGDLYTYAIGNTRLPLGVNGQVLTVDTTTPTGLKWSSTSGGGSGTVVGFTFTNANGISGTVATPTTTPNLTLSLGAITPTSIAASGTITGSNLSGTNTGDQTITLTGDVTGSGTGSFATTLSTVSIAKGGTGQTTANAAFNALAPSQTGNNGKVLITDGSNTSWAAFPGAGSVTSVSAVGNQGVTASVSNPTTVPTINIGLGAITPTSVAATGTVTGSNITGTASGTNTGDQTISLLGDATGSGTAGINVTLANTGVVAGSYTLANIIVDSKGRITAASNGVIDQATSQVFSSTSSVDASIYNVAKFQLAGNVTIPLPTNVPIGRAYTITYFIKQAGGTSYTVSWANFSAAWRGSVTPIMTATYSATDIYILTTFDNGSSWIGTASQGYL